MRGIGTIVCLLFLFFFSIEGVSFPFKSDQYGLLQPNEDSSISSQVVTEFAYGEVDSSWTFLFWFKSDILKTTSGKKAASIRFFNATDPLSFFFFYSDESGDLNQVTVAREGSSCSPSSFSVYDLSLPSNSWFLFSFSVNTSGSLISFFPSSPSAGPIQSNFTSNSCLHPPRPSSFSLGAPSLTNAAPFLYKDVQFWKSWKSVDSLSSLIYHFNFPLSSSDPNLLLFWSFQPPSQCVASSSSTGIVDSSGKNHSGECQVGGSEGLQVIPDGMSDAQFIAYSSASFPPISPFLPFDSFLSSGFIPTSSSSSSLFSSPQNNGIFLPFRSLCYFPSSSLLINASYSSSSFPSSFPFLISTSLNRTSSFGGRITGYSPTTLSTFGGKVSLMGNELGVEGALTGEEHVFISFLNASTAEISCVVFNSSRMDCIFPPSFDSISLSSVSLCQTTVPLDLSVLVSYAAPLFSSVQGIDFQSFQILGSNLGGDSSFVTFQITVIDSLGVQDSNWIVNSNSSSQSLLLVTRPSSSSSLRKRQGGKIDLKDKESYTFMVEYTLGEMKYQLKNESIYAVDCGELKCQLGYCNTINPSAPNTVGYKQCSCYSLEVGGIECSDTTTCSTLGCTATNPCRAFGPSNILQCQGSANNSNVTGLIVGLVIGGIVLLVVVAIVVFILLRRRRGNAKADFFIPLENKSFERVMYGSLVDQPLDRRSLPSDQQLQLLENYLTSCDIHSIFELFNAGGQGEADLFVLSLLVLLEDHSKSSTILEEALTVEIRKAESSTTLFRSNSLTTKLFTCYSKMIAIEYLYETLGPPVSQLLGEEIKLEVDPERMEPGADFDEARWFLMGNTQKCLKAIFHRVDQYPSTLSSFLHQVETKVAAMFPGSQRSSVGSFIFLRFFCPAISTPDVFGLSDERPSDTTKRVLILITKILQNLSNDVRFGEKEPHMASCNDFINSNHKKLDEYYAKLLKPSSKPNVKREIPKDIKTKALGNLYLHSQKVVDRIENEETKNKLQECLR